MNAAKPLAFNAVLFDFDGTLVDTMPLHYEAYRRTFAEIDIELTPQDFYSQIGGTGPETIPKFLRGRPSPWTIEEIHRRKKETLSAMLEAVEVPQLPTSYLLPLLKGRVPLALATSGNRVSVQAMLNRLGWTKYFDAIVTADDVAKGKPAPDLFLRAASLLGIDPCECLIFEDTDDGAAAGRAAGAKVIDVRRLTFPLEHGC